MTASPYFTETERKHAIRHFGQEVYERSLQKIKVYAAKWSLSSVHFVPYYSANLVFTCVSKRFGKAVLKVGNTSLKEVETEYYSLAQYNGRGFCRVYEVDLEQGVILVERIEPGNPLRDERSLEKRLSIFCSLHSGLHETVVGFKAYPTYTDWVRKISEYMKSRSDWTDLYRLMSKAYDHHLDICVAYADKKLLHGDLHHDNILLGENGVYRVIDPKGVIGDPVLDIARFILNEFDENITTATYEKVTQIIASLGENLQIPRHVLKKCLFVEAAMATSWCVEDNTLEEHPHLMDAVTLAEAILDG